MSYENLKQAAALAALDYIEPGIVLGVGTGSTVNYFIEGLRKIKNKIEMVVASSKATADRLAALPIRIEELNYVSEIALYVDGADEVNHYKQMIKGGGGAHTQEKIIASAAKKFICIADASKQVELLGTFPVAVEVIPMARSFVARQIIALGGDPIYRVGFLTDNGNVILDVHNLKLLNPLEIEKKLNNIPGVVANGIFAARCADQVLLATDNGIRVF